MTNKQLFREICNRVDPDDFLMILDLDTKDLLIRFWDIVLKNKEEFTSFLGFPDDFSEED